MAEPPPPVPPPPAAEFLRSWRTHPYRWLALFAAVYFVVSVSLSYVRVLEFTVTNWDLGIFQQALWSSGHGRLLYEAGDWESYGTMSFLQVHPAPVLLLLVPIYTIAPFPITLFLVQSGAVGLAALPLFWIVRGIFGEPKRALALSALFLGFAPVLTSNLYDFHLEAFLPLELFLVFVLWKDGRYAWGALFAVITFLTLEVTPFLVAALALFFLLEPVERRFPWPRTRIATPPSERAPGFPRIARFLQEPRIRYATLLLVISALAFVLLRLFEWWVVPLLLGAPAEVPGGAQGALGVASSSALGLSFNLFAHLGVKLTYWLLLLALLGFLPLFAPRALVLSLPWFFFTLQSNLAAWSVLGFQYGFIAVPGLLIATAYGLANAEAVVLPRMRPWLRQWAGSSARSPRVGPRRFRRIPSRSAVAPLVLLVLLVGVNLTFTPLNPQRQNLESALSAYRVSYALPAGYEGVARAASFIPSDAAVLASDDLFPFVANNLQAYSLLWTPAQPVHLPFNSTTPPPFVFLCSDQYFAVPLWLWNQLANLTVYGLVAVVPSTPVGLVLLYETGFAGPVTILGPNSPAGGFPPFRG